MRKVNGRVPCVKEGSTFKAYNTINGKPYGSIFKIVNGKATVLGKPFIVKPQSLLGKKEGAPITISGQLYVIKEIQ